MRSLSSKFDRLDRIDSSRLEFLEVLVRVKTGLKGVELRRHKEVED